jgi:hypothetical protein
VNKRSIDKYLCLISGGWSRGMPIDVQQRVLINESKLKAAVCVPFLSSTSPHSNDSDIRGQLDASRRVYRCYSRALFIDADHAELIRELRQHLAGAKVPPLAEIYLGAVAFSLSDKFEKF